MADYGAMVSMGNDCGTGDGELAKQAGLSVEAYRARNKEWNDESTQRSREADQKRQEERS